jgi:hypothetical protein
MGGRVRRTQNAPAQAVRIQRTPRLLGSATNGAERTSGCAALQLGVLRCNMAALQHGAVRCRDDCNMARCVAGTIATWRAALQHGALRCRDDCNMARCVATWCGALQGRLQHSALRCNMVRCVAGTVATWRFALQHGAVRCRDGTHWFTEMIITKSGAWIVWLCSATVVPAASPGAMWRAATLPEASPGTMWRAR